MGNMHGAICKMCGNKFNIRVGGGFYFHLVYCEKCGKERKVGINLIRGLRDRYLTGVIDKERYINMVEKLSGKCRCGGNYRLNPPLVCPKCRRNKLLIKLA